MAASTRNFRPGRVARSLRWLVAGAVFAIVAGCGGGSASAPSATGGGGGGSGDGGGDGGGGGPVTTGLKLVPPRLGLTVGSDGRLLAVNAGAMPSWMSSDARVATVDSEGRVQAVAKGSAVITATSGSEVATSTLTVYQTEGPSPDATSESLIDAALAQNRIDAETALTYRVFAVFGDERLPIAYEGAPSAAPPHLLLRELMTTIGTLSPAAQAVLRPFLLPPIYADSWFAQRLGLGASAQASAQHRATAARAKALSTVNCAVGIAPSLYAKVSTVHFNVYYTVFGGTSYVAENAKSAAAAAMVAAIIEQVYDAEIKLVDPLDRLDDSKEACSGGDGKYDIYYGPYGLGGIAAWTTSYALPPDQIGKKSECALRPSFMSLNSLSIEFATAEQQPANSGPMVKSLLAHEFLHALQFTIDRAASCKDLEWLDEATAQWAMDHLVPTIAQGLPGEFGMEPGVGNVASGYPKSGTVLAAYLYAGHLTSIEKPGPGLDPKLNGYSDYLFFQYLARTQGPDTIRQIFDALAGGRNSVEAIAAAVDMKSVWPAFARTLWIGWEDKVLDYWANEDEYKFGLAQVYAQVPTVQTIPQEMKDRQKTTPVDQKGQKSAQFELLANALAFSGNYEVEPRSILYEHLKFSDPSVHAVVFYNPIADRPDNGPMKLEALKKIGGKWQPPEDWTPRAFQTYCLDNQDERLEELLLIVSNSDANRASETPFVISNLSPMKQATSNVGCWQWFGSASVTTETAFGYTTVESMTGPFVRFRALSDDPNDKLVGLDVFVADVTSRVTYSVSGPITGTSCTISGTGTANPKVPGEGSMFVNYLTLDGPPTPLERMAVGSGQTTVPGVSTTISCPGKAPEVTVLDQATNWLAWPSDGVPVSADGRTISGTWTEVDPDGTRKTSVWNFTSVRQ
jgi:Bacterial Ig-like domain (group 2)